MRGDGNCLYSALAYGFLEALLITDKLDYLKQLVADLHEKKLVIHDIYLPKNQEGINSTDIERSKDSHHSPTVCVAFTRRSLPVGLPVPYHQPT